MWCCVPRCKTTTEIVSGSECITFHEFPSDVHLRAAWLRALGKQDYHPLDTAVVCSLHFLSNDFYATESGSRQIRAGAIPSIVQVCMICFDTQSKLYPMSKYKLDEAYQHLVGHPLCDLGNLTQTLCVQCAQRLVNFNKFRDKSLRARSLMLELVKKHELITIRHIKSISRVKHKLRSDIMKTFLGPDQFDVYIAHSDTDAQTETAEAVAMEHDKSDSMLVDAVQSLSTAVTSADSDADSCNASFAYKEEHLSDDSNPSAKQMSDPPATTSSLCETKAETLALVKQEMTFACTTCLKEFADEDMYIHHTLMHTEDTWNPDGDSVADCSPSSVAAVASTLKTDQESTEHPTDEKAEVETIAALPAGLATKHENEEHPTDTNEELDILLFEDNKPQITMLQPDKSLAKLSDINFDTTRGNELFNIKQSVPDYGKIEKKTSPESQQKQYICDICQKRYKRKCFLINHVKSHSSIKILLTCKFCKYQCKSNSILVQHMRTHTGEKPYACELCDYKCGIRANLVLHMRTHTGDKPYACDLCDYRCGVRRNLVPHMRTHTGEKPYFCELCDYKCSQKSSLVLHMRTHTGEKPYACDLCDYKCTVRGSLVQHMRTHTGEKPFTCDNCKYKFRSYSNLVLHMRTHTGEKPYACELCDYKFGIRRNLVIHMRTHTGEKPYACELCDYKCRVRSILVMHMRTHTGEKPYFCESCDFKSKQRSNLVRHMRTHTGGKS